MRIHFSLAPTFSVFPDKSAGRFRGKIYCGFSYLIENGKPEIEAVNPPFLDTGKYWDENLGG